MKNYWVIPGIEIKFKTKHEKAAALIDRICKKFEISKEDLISKKRFREVVEPRKIGMYIMHKVYGISSIQTGNYFNKDHATVLHASKAVQGYLDYDKEYKNLVNNLI